MLQNRSSGIYRFLISGQEVLVSIAIASIAYMINQGSIYPSIFLLTVALTSRLTGLDISSLGYLAAMILSIAMDIAPAIPIYIVGLVASLAISYLTLRTPRELWRYKAMESLKTVSLILLAIPLSQYTWLVAVTLRPQDPFPLGVVIMVALIMLIAVILRGGRDLEQILEPLVRSPEALSKTYLYMARLLTIIASIAYATITSNPIPVIVLIIAMMITRIVTKKISTEDIKTIAEIPVPLTILIYILLL
ncbi:MAG TPA: hypothetical protein VNL13_09470 [Sulfolobales archaeon]|nr:hypothetical protein [Sulfolobales archaeon]